MPQLPFNMGKYASMGGGIDPAVLEALRQATATPPQAPPQQPPPDPMATMPEIPSDKPPALWKQLLFGAEPDVTPQQSYQNKMEQRRQVLGEQELRSVQGARDQTSRLQADDAYQSTTDRQALEAMYPDLPPEMVKLIKGALGGVPTAPQKSGDYANDPERLHNALRDAQNEAAAAQTTQLGTMPGLDPVTKQPIGVLGTNELQKRTDEATKGPGSPTAQQASAMEDQRAANARRLEATRGGQARLTASEARDAAAQGVGGGGAGGALSEEAIQAIMDNPLIYGDLTPTMKGQAFLPLSQRGFDFSGNTGLTPSMAAGVQRLGTSVNILKGLDSHLTGQEGPMGRAAGAGQALWALSGGDTEATLYGAISKALLPALARSSGEVGNLAEAEQTRYAMLAPKVTDPINIRWAKYAAIQYIIDAAEAGKSADEMRPFLDYMEISKQYGGQSSHAPLNPTGQMPSGGGAAPPQMPPTGAPQMGRTGPGGGPVSQIPSALLDAPDGEYDLSDGTTWVKKGANIRQIK